MKAYNASFATTFWRYNLIIAITIASFLIGVPMLTLIVVPLFVATLMGISFTEKKVKKAYPNLSVYPAEIAEKAEEVNIRKVA